VRGPGGDGGGAGVDAVEAAAEDPAKAGDSAGDPEAATVSREGAGYPAPRVDGGVKATVAIGDGHAGDAGGVVTCCCTGAEHKAGPCSVPGEATSGSERAEECSSESSWISAPVSSLCV
jgi:hypothetical protein